MQSNEAGRGFFSPPQRQKSAGFETVVTGAATMPPGERVLRRDMIAHALLPNTTPTTEDMSTQDDMSTPCFLLKERFVA